MREDPNIGSGKVVVSLTIAPNGSVTDCKLVSSTFNNPDLERKIVQRVLLLNFGAKDVPAFTFPNYPINFLPSCAPSHCLFEAQVPAPFFLSRRCKICPGDHP